MQTPIPNPRRDAALIVFFTVCLCGLFIAALTMMAALIGAGHA